MHLHSHSVIPMSFYVHECDRYISKLLSSKYYTLAWRFLHCAQYSGPKIVLFPYMNCLFFILLLTGISVYFLFRCPSCSVYRHDWQSAKCGRDTMGYTLLYNKLLMSSSYSVSTYFVVGSSTLRAWCYNAEPQAQYTVRNI